MRQDQIWLSYRAHWQRLGLLWAVWVADRALGRKVPDVWPGKNVRSYDH